MYFLIAMAATVALVPTDARVVFRKVDNEENSATKVVYSDGTIRTKGSNLDLSEPCGIGPQIVYMKRPDGTCYDDDSFNIKYGSVNQISLDPQRTVYVGSAVTMVEDEVIRQGGPAYEQVLYIASAKGKTGSQSNVVTVTGSSDPIMVGNFTARRLPPNSIIRSSHPQGQFCSTLQLTCGLTAATGSSEDVFIYMEGNGTTTKLVGGGSSLQGKDKYLPTQYTTLDGTPIGIDWDSFIRGYESFGNRREKRQVAIALATATLVRVEMTNKAMREAFRVSDQNFVVLREKQYEAELKTKEIAEMVALEKETRAIDQGQQRRLNLRNSFLDTILEKLGDKAQYLNDYTIYFNVYDKQREILQREDLANLRKVALEGLVNATILDERVSGTTVYYTIQEGPIAEGDLEHTCYLDECIIKGKPFLYKREGEAERVENPSFSTTSCGVYLQGLDALQEAVVRAKTTVESVVVYARTNGLHWLTVTGLLCPAGAMVPTSPTFYNADQSLKKVNMSMTHVGYGQFKLDCKLEEGNSTDLGGRWIQNSPFCKQIFGVEEAKTFATTIEPKQMVLNSVLQAFLENADFQEWLNKLPEETRKNLVKSLSALGGIPADVIKKIGESDPEEDLRERRAALFMGGAGLLFAIGLGVYVLLYRIRKRQGKRSGGDC